MQCNESYTRLPTAFLDRGLSACGRKQAFTLVLVEVLGRKQRVAAFIQKPQFSPAGDVAPLDRNTQAVQKIRD